MKLAPSANGIIKINMPTVSFLDRDIGELPAHLIVDIYLRRWFEVVTHSMGILHCPSTWRGGRVVEGARLEIV